jgi:hypothetical protein
MRRTRSASPVPEFHWTLAKPRAETLLDLPPALACASRPATSAGRFSPLGPVGMDLFPKRRKIVFGTVMHVTNKELFTRPLSEELLVWSPAYGCIRGDPLANNVLAIPTILLVREIGRMSCSVENLRGNRHSRSLAFLLSLARDAGAMRAIVKPLKSAGCSGRYCCFSI